MPPHRSDHRSPEAAAYRRLYNTSRWKHPKHGVRAEQLRKQPLCEFCLKANRITVATVCDHVDPKSKETEDGFYRGPFASLCKTHHDSTKQIIEARGYEPGCDRKGRPIAADHPWNKRP